jgi:hypothetical protein
MWVYEYDLETTIFSVREPIISALQYGHTSVFWCEEYADCCLTFMELSSMNLSLKVKLKQGVYSCILHCVWDVCKSALIRVHWRLIFFFHPSNASAHSNFLLHEFMAEGMIVIPCTPYSSVPSSCDFFLFQKLKLVLGREDLMTSSSFKNNCRLHFPSSKHRASAGSSNNGSVAGHAAWSCKRTFLKGAWNRGLMQLL